MEISKLKDITDIIAAIATVVAILVGGFWSYTLFVRKRQKYPRANITHRVTPRPMTNSQLLLNVAVTISNPGEVLLSLVSGEIRIQQILPPPSELLNSINQGHDPVEEGQTEVQWPLIASRKSKWEKGKLEIEPGESDQLQYDFILDAKVQTIQVYSYLRNAKKRRREIGWGLTTIYDLQSSSQESGRPLDPHASQPGT